MHVRGSMRSEIRVEVIAQILEEGVSPLSIISCFSCGGPSHVLEGFPKEINLMKAAISRLEYLEHKTGKKETQCCSICTMPTVVGERQRKVHLYSSGRRRYHGPRQRRDRDGNDRNGTKWLKY